VRAFLPQSDAGTVSDLQRSGSEPPRAAPEQASAVEPSSDSPKGTRRSVLQTLGALEVGAVDGAAVGSDRARAADGAGLVAGYVL
jgi:hypothetical protein